MRKIIVLALFLAGCADIQAIEDRAARTKAPYTAQAANHCFQVGQQARTQPQPFVHNAYGMTPNLQAFGFAQGQQDARAAQAAENECRLRYGLAPK